MGIPWLPPGWPGPAREGWTPAVVVTSASDSRVAPGGAIPLRIVDPPGWDNMEPGQMWRDPVGDVPGRECWTIVLPNTHPDIGTPGHPSMLLWSTTDGYYGSGGMWDVSGIPPNITVSPSINVLRFVLRDGQSVQDGSYWHGWIVAGALGGG